MLLPLAGREMVGERLSHYRIVEQIGAGGMGVVYRADVAVKVLLSSSFCRRFRAQAVSQRGLVSRASQPSQYRDGARVRHPERRRFPRNRVHCGDHSRCQTRQGGDALLAQGDLAGARKQYEQALALCKQLDDEDFTAQIQGSLASIAWYEKRYAEAFSLLIKSADHLADCTS